MGDSVTRRGDLLAPLLLGLAGGGRTFVPPAALVLRGRRPPGRSGWLLLASAALELIYDKLPLASTRLRREALAARGISSGLSGAALGGLPGAGVAVAAAAGGAFAGHRARVGLTAVRPRRALLWAVVEDILVMALAAAAMGRQASSGDRIGPSSSSAVGEPGPERLARPNRGHRPESGSQINRRL